MCDVVKICAIEIMKAAEFCLAVLLCIDTSWRRHTGRREVVNCTNFDTYLDVFLLCVSDDCC